MGGGELSRPEVLAVVRHLLTGCPRCVEVTRRLWALGEWAPHAAETLVTEGAEDPTRLRCRRAGVVWT